MILTALVDGLIALFAPQALLFLLIGVVYGLIIGILPGLGGVVALALLLPFTYGYDPSATIALLLGAHVATIWGDSVTSILFNVPGASKSIALMFDGHPMTRKGEAARALGASSTAALLGGIFGAIFLALSIPVIRPVILTLGPAEYLMMGLWGMTIIATFSSGSVLKGLAASCLGVLVAFVGMDPVTATSRYTFGSTYLLDGIDFGAAMIGMFAVSEMIKLYVSDETIVRREAGAEHSTFFQGFRDCFVHWGVVVKSSLLGVWLGVLPGIGGGVGGVAAYAQVVQTSKTPEIFGTGAVEGVIAPEATLGANEGGGLLPTLAFGIPGSEGMALLLVAFVNLGMHPGPRILETQLDFVFLMVWLIVFASALVLVIAMVITPFLARLPGLNPNLMIPLVLSICLIGAATTRGRVEDVIVAAIFGIVGYFMHKYRYSRANFVIGAVLAAMIERNLQISRTLYGDFFLLERPIALAMFIFVLVTTALPFIRARRRKKAKAAESASTPGVPR